ncbi:glutamine synthetase family protein [Flavobacterium laiguense]|uniref:Glutamine synthetase n=1 Tax=Flavobacterium laiguense TaxID=2169409 RepID=A0A2U1K007_9FLAO|nr:glutamine synthetase family protein [Flavobacterium laiguense]PWA10816.1 glutamine synthetase [Flavobacterium laiguense]
MNKIEIIDYIKHHPSGKVKLAICDIDGVLRGKYISTEKFLSICDSDFGYCDVVFGWDMADVAYDKGSFTGWHTGYPDAKVKLDFNTFRKIPWENNIPFFLGEFIKVDGNPLEICPRQLLKKIENQANTAGFTPLVSQEFEWFNFAETPESAAAKNFQNLNPLTPGMFGYSILRTSLKNDYFTDLFDLLTQFDIPVEGLHTETGPGTYEIAIKYGTSILSGDRATLFKTSVKEIAYKHGIMATFMAKISENLPGCGGHIHQSIWNSEASQNLFFDENDPNKMSDMMRSYIAGQLLCLPQILPMIAPTVNSYKRLVEGAWAPTTLTWGIDNRTVALRSLPLGSKSCRLETRIIGADTNPYLALSACLAAGLYGIKNNLELKQARTIGNGYTDESNGRLSKNLIDSTMLMKNSKIANELFGETFVQHFTQSREWEWRQFSKAVTDWEMKRYFEII